MGNTKWDFQIGIIAPNCGAKMDGETEGNDDNTDLKPCPFCGGDVRFDKAYSYFRDSVIYCDGCDMVFTLDDCAASDVDIIKAWNRRADNG
jgi:Lar family restriction alleviation protein